MTVGNKAKKISLTTGETLWFDPYQDHTVLDTLLRSNIKALYGCREGYCHDCRCTLVSGQVARVGDPIVPEDTSKILPCSSRPMGDIELDLTRR